MSYTIVGKCSLCGGRVTLPNVWFGVYPPEPQCQKCGATHHKEDTMPVLKMRPVKKTSMDDFWTKFSNYVKEK